jgi:hypothetical protein
MCSIVAFPRVRVRYLTSREVVAVSVKGDPAAELRAELGPDLPAVDALTPAQSADLLAMLREAREGQRRALDEAMAEVLRYLPRLARGPARKILFGKEGR